ncbi:cytochrome P450 [Amycolatopsis sp. NPDC049159]|uniref:cytochrome P450 n=1 Tax=Amycolatopsis sp. NPDC049159 TaxID=3157210 RepID=UPI0033C69DBD
MSAPEFPFTEGPGLEPPVEYGEILGAGALCPVTLAGGRHAVLVTRHADVRTVLGDPRFSREAHGALFDREAGSLALLLTDPPVHTRRRRTVAAGFTARQAEAARPGLAALAAELVAGLRARGTEAELVEEFAVPFTLAVISDLLGVPAADRGRFRPWVNAMMSRGHASPEEVAEGHRAMHEYFTALVDEIWAGDTRDGIIADLAPVPGRAGELSREEAIVMSAGLLVAGYESTSNQLASCVYLLLTERARWESLVGEPAALDRAIEEMLRWTSFTTGGGTPHVATEDVRLTDRLVRRGEVVVPLTDAANRDAEVFADPDRLDLTREPNPHVAFGAGRHRCLGAELARAELQTGLAVLLRELPGLELAVPEGALRWRREMQVSGVWELPVRWAGDAR